jgi:pilus assembly protein CpaF
MNEEELKQYLAKHKEELFDELKDEIDDNDITDIEWDGYNLWITHLKKGSYLSRKKLGSNYVDNLSIRLANIMMTSFNRSNPVLEANTENLRISIWHESRCGAKSIAIRKIPRSIRFSHESLIGSGYAPETIINLLENCTRAHMNCVIGGQPHAGKTELLKYMSTYIPASEKVGVYEDNQEIHYRTINPGKKCVEFRVDERFGYSQIIKAGLRHNVDWVLLSESRGQEVLDLLNSLSTGAYCMTTMHLDEVKNIPDRMYNMLGESNVADRFINSIYQYIDVGVLVECDKYEHRSIREVGFFTRTAGKNSCIIVYEDGEFTSRELPQEIMQRFAKYGINNPYGENRSTV